VFTQALIDITRRLDEAKTRGLLKEYALIGGFAVSAWGISRATHDIDFALALGSADPVALSRHLRAEYRRGEPHDPLQGVYRIRVAVKDHEIPVQLIVFPPAWTPIIVDGIVALPVLGCSVPVISWQGLILLKLYAGGPQDLLDAQHILDVRQPNRDGIEEIARLADRVHLSTAFRRLVDRS